MKSLEERRKFRAKQRAEEMKRRDESPSQATDETDSGSDDGKFDASAWVNDSVTNIAAQIGELSDEELDAVETAEKAGKDRVGVKDAIEAERAKRKQSAGGWNSNAG